MLSFRLIQTACSLVFVAAFGAAELCAAYLQAHPASATAWYLTIEIFHPFELARSGVSPMRWLFGPWSLAGAVAAAVAMVACYRLNFRLGIALATNLTFLGALALAWANASRSVGYEVAIQSTLRVKAWDGRLICTLLLSSFAACALSHVQFVSLVGRRNLNG